MTGLSVIILAAGKGTRLGKPHPKPLTELSTGETIMARQVRLIHDSFGDARINIVVGFMHEQIRASFPAEQFVENARYEETNTSKSLLLALRATPKNDGVLWLNGDVVFHQDVLELFLPYIDGGVSVVGVDTSTVAEEEVKYTLDESGAVQRISKTINPTEALGEAVGINYVSAGDKAVLIKELENVLDSDYFEMGMERAVASGEIKFSVVDISNSGFGAVEVDFGNDLDRANESLDTST